MAFIRKTIKVDVEECTGFTCDKCSEFFPCSNFIEWQEMIHIKHSAGYGSKFGDGNEIDLTICNNCAYEMFKDFV